MSGTGVDGDDQQPPAAKSAFPTFGSIDEFAVWGFSLGAARGIRRSGRFQPGLDAAGLEHGLEAGDELRVSVAGRRMEMASIPWGKGIEAIVFHTIVDQRGVITIHAARGP
jgi:hypothetical protein